MGSKAKKTAKKGKTEAEKIQEEIDSKTAELQKCLESLERKKKLSSHRTVFLTALDNIQEAEDKLNEVSEFESKLYKLTFEDGSNYQRNSIFAISNTDLLKDFIVFIRKRIHAKIAEIEKELMAE